MDIERLHVFEIQIAWTVLSENKLLSFGFQGKSDTTKRNARKFVETDVKKQITELFRELGMEPLMVKTVTSRRLDLDFSMMIPNANEILDEDLPPLLFRMVFGLADLQPFIRAELLSADIESLDDLCLELRYAVSGIAQAVAIGFFEDNVAELKEIGCSVSISLLDFEFLSNFDL